MEIKDMQAFYAIVEEGNISHAAIRLNIAQPALSRQMKRLEDSLGVKLFERGSRRIRLTDAGLLLYSRVKHILGMVDGTVRELVDIGSGVAGTVKLGTITSSGSMLIPELVADFTKEYPLVTFQVWEGDGARVLELLDSHIVEIAITRTQVDNSSYESIILPDEPLVLAVPKSLGVGQEDEEYIHINDLKDKPLLVPLRWKSTFMAHCQKANFEPKILSVSDSQIQNMLWTQLGIGISLVPLSARSMMHSDNVVFKRIKEAEIYTHTVVSWLKNRTMSSSCQHFIKMFRQKYVK
ncbi:LysR family transcriptional regulator [Anaerovibrio sp.]|uniref:LysR family transcriptional regulator n=1 Tax=Anaerovibrio sp. TaxID=1872532 RepID=UPI001B621C7D|nr:LysR family transcriptional regulator [Anaerovibrio sp.]MBP3232005.1 LysR family transcriptional regulator [Anaerovibrio sp.]MBR2143344.1 LysR family transcriptional regulator [Anaerovibrio sp.]